MSPLFTASKQSVYGKPLKLDKQYPNAYFTNLAHEHFFYTYIFRIFTLGFFDGKAFTSAEKKKYKVYGDDIGLYQYYNGNKHYLEDGDYLYIVSPKGGLYALKEKVRHNAVRAAQPVQCAGHTTIKNKQIVLIKNDSGHYCPTTEQFYRTVRGLYVAKLITLDAIVELFDMNTDLERWDSIQKLTVKALMSNTMQLLNKHS
jgi:hypothetical protein